MVNLEHSVTLKSTRKIGLRSSSRNVNDSQATLSTSGTNEDENCGKKIYLKKKTMKENHSLTSLETLSKRNLKFTRVTSKN